MKFVFKKINAILLIIAILATVLGYIIMGTGDKTISPIILIIAYVVLFPAAILYGMKKGNKNQNQELEILYEISFRRIYCYNR